MLTAETALYAHFYQGKTDRLEERLETSIQNQPTANGLVTEAHIRFELGQFDLFPFLQRRAEEIPGFGVEEGNWIVSAPRLFGDTYLTLGLKDLAGRWMVGRYDDAIFLSEGRYDEAIEFLKTEFETGKDKPIFWYRWHPDIIASLVEAYLYAGRYDELTAFLDALSWQWGLFPLPGCCLTNPPWPEVAYTFALFETGRTEQGQEWLAHLNVDLEDRLAQGIDVPNHYYELARIRAMQGRVPEAFAAMERAIEKGWRRWYFDLDPILEPIRKLPEFAVLKMQYDADIARLHDVVAVALAADTPGTAQ
jgi:tetratricopeptide (TPR) repeat protein